MQHPAETMRRFHRPVKTYSKRTYKVQQKQNANDYWRNHKVRFSIRQFMLLFLEVAFVTFGSVAVGRESGVKCDAGKDNSVHRKYIKIIALLILSHLIFIIRQFFYYRHITSN